VSRELADAVFRYMSPTSSFSEPNLAVFAEFPVPPEEPENFADEFLAGQAKVDQPFPREDGFVKREVIKLRPRFDEEDQGVLPEQLTVAQLDLLEPRVHLHPVRSKISAVDKEVSRMENGGSMKSLVGTRAMRT
tara:strand:+ start:149 stop:550 length:402 start_codon:yes stop_codon:yes gene_type:complete